MDTPENLVWAAEETDLELARRLLDAGVHPDDRLRPGGVTPLMCVVDRPSSFYDYEEEQVARLLLAAGADVNAVTSEGWTPIHGAAHGGGSATRLLLEHGANPNVASVEAHLTPLHMAVDYCEVDAVSALLDAGADRSAVDAHGKTALDLAESEAERFPDAEGDQLVALLQAVFKAAP